MAAAVAVVLLAACSSSSDAQAPSTASASTVISVVPDGGTTTTTTFAAGSTTVAGGRVPEGFSSVVIEVTRPDGTVVEWCVLLAETPRQLARGLMEVDSLGGYDGMLFAFDGETESSFYMLNTRIPLSVAWFAPDGAFVSSTDMEPCPDDDDDPPCPRYSAEGPYTKALEVPWGGLEALGIGPGATLRSLDRPC